MKMQNVLEIIKPVFRLKLGWQNLSGEHVLIIAPHPDDEVLGCGGTIQTLLEHDCNIDVLLMTGSPERIKEFKDGLNILGNIDYVVLGFTENKLVDENVTNIMRTILTKRKYDVIFCPYIFDFHKDHRMAVKALADACDINYDFLICMYEIWTPILYPDLFIDITKNYGNKRRAIKCHKSQLDKFSLLKRDLYLRKLRGELLMKQPYYLVEAFRCIKINELKMIVNEYYK